MIHFYAIALLVLCGQVELFKLGLMPAPPASGGELSSEYYQPLQRAQFQQLPYASQQVFPARPSYQPYQSYQPAPAIAYVIVRPVTPSYPYYDSSVRYWAPLQQQQLQASSFESSGVKGGLPALAEADRGTKSGYLKQEDQQQILEQQPINQPLLHQQQQSVDHAYDLGMGKLLKIKSSFDKLAASAKSKLSLGSSSYYVASEEIVPPAAPALPLRQEQAPVADLQLTKLEQQHIENNAEQTKLETQQQLEDSRQNYPEQQQEELPLRETKGLQQEPVRETKTLQQEPLKEIKGLKPQEQVREEPAREVKGIQQQEPLRETKGYQQEPLRETKTLKQEPLGESKGFQKQQELREPIKSLDQQKPIRETTKDLDQQQPLELKAERNQEKELDKQRPLLALQQQREELHRDQIKYSEHRDLQQQQQQVRFNGQQQPLTSYYSGAMADSADGFGKRISSAGY